MTTQALQIFNYKGSQVRVVEKDGESWFCLADICRSIGIKHAITSRLSVRDQDVKSIHTPTAGGNQLMTYVNEQGLFDTVGGSRKKLAREYRRWLLAEVLPPLRKKVNLSENIAGAVEATAKALALFGERLAGIDQRLSVVEQGRAPAAVLPPPAVVPDISTRSHLNKIVRQYAYDNQLSYRDVWERLYYEFKYRYHLDLKTRALNAGDSLVLDTAERLGCLNNLLALAKHLFVVRRN